MDQWGFIAAVGALLMAMTAAYGAIIAQLRRHNAHQQGELDELLKKVTSAREKVDVAWDFQMRRAHAEAMKEVARMPAITACETVGEERVPMPVREAMTPIVPDLKMFYQRMTEKGIESLDEGEMALEIERGFGEWIVKNICIPFRQSHGECLIYALRLAKEQPRT